MKYIRVKNWDDFQHYKDRNPPWIKLYNRLLSDYDFCCLPDASKLQLMLLWLLASQIDNKIPADVDWVKSKIMVRGKVDLQALISSGFIELYQDASTKQADCEQVDIPERETKTKKEIKKRKKYGEFGHVLLDDDQYNKLYFSFGESKCNALIKKLDEGIEKKGYKYKNFYLAALDWAKSNDIKKRSKREIHEEKLQGALDTLTRTPDIDCDNLRDKLVDLYGAQATKEAYQIVEMRAKA